jgi:hypothetical protein
MSRTRNRIIGTLAAALAVAALAPAASVGFTDHRSPDAQYPTPGVQASDYQDHRSPDAKDPYRLGPSLSPAPTPTAETSGFDRGDASIAAGAVLGLVLIGLSVMVVHRRSRRLEGAADPAVTT